MKNLMAMTKAEGKTVDLCSLPDEEEAVTETVASHAALTLFSVDRSVEPLLFLVKNSSK